MALTITEKLIQDPVLKRFTRDEIKKMIKTPEVRELLEKLSLKHSIPVPEVMKALLEEIQIEAKELTVVPKPGLARLSQ